jgi:hypothetical protein
MKDYRLWNVWNKGYFSFMVWQYDIDLNLEYKNRGFKKIANCLKFKDAEKIANSILWNGTRKINFLSCKCKAKDKKYYRNLIVMPLWVYFSEF